MQRLISVTAQTNGVSTRSTWVAPPARPFDLDDAASGRRTRPGLAHGYRPRAASGVASRAGSERDPRRVEPPARCAHRCGRRRRDAPRDRDGEGRRQSLGPQYVAGGLIDIEFISPHLQLIHAARRPTSSTRRPRGSTRRGARPSPRNMPKCCARRRGSIITHQILRLCLSALFDRDRSPGWSDCSRARPTRISPRLRRIWPKPRPMRKLQEHPRRFSP